MELRGFDSYPITLGDEMRGERASLGKSLEDAERDLRIKARMIVAIENCDLEGFPPNRSVIPGYVRSYARYLGMDPDDCYRRFCEESGYQSPTSQMFGQDGDGARSGSRIVADLALGAELARSRFANPPARTRFQARIPLGAITSSVALLGLIAGLGYGGYALLQDIQRVGFAPIPEAPTVVADAPVIAAPEVSAETLPLPDASDYQDGGVFAAVTLPSHLQPVEDFRRDGPISAIDPRTAGVFAAEAAAAEAPAEPAVAGSVAGIYAAEEAIHATPRAAGPDLAALATATPGAGRTAPGVAATEPKIAGVSLHASEDAWIRVREHDNVVFEGILAAGEKYELPARLDGPVLKAGNAGGLYIFVDGVAYGPLGERGQIARNVSLAAEDIRHSIRQANAAEVGPAASGAVQRSAEAAAAHRD